MGYAIVGGIGLLVGIGLMIWGLRERSKRHEAERAADKAKAAEKEALALAEANAGAAGLLQGQLSRLEGQVAAQRERIGELRKLVADKAPMPLIKEWIDKEGEGGEL